MDEFESGFLQEPSMNPSFVLVRNAIFTDLLHSWKFEPFNLTVVRCIPGWSKACKKRGSLL